MIDSLKRIIQIFKPAKKKVMGYHFAADLSGCERNIEDGEELRKLALEAVEIAKMNSVGSFAITIPDGSESGASCLECIVPLKESHLAIHTWPHYRFVSIDLFTCGNKEAAVEAMLYLIDYFQPQKLETWGTERVCKLL